MHRVGKPTWMAKPIWMTVACSLSAWAQGQPSAPVPEQMVPAHMIVTSGSLLQP